MGPNSGPYNGYPVSSFSHCEEESVRCAAFKPHVELELGQPARGIKSPTKRKHWIEQTQRMKCEAPNIDRPAGSKLQGKHGKRANNSIESSG